MAPRMWPEGWVRVWGDINYSPGSKKYHGFSIHTGGALFIRDDSEGYKLMWWGIDEQGKEHASHELGPFGSFIDAIDHAHSLLPQAKHTGLNCCRLNHCPSC